MSKERARRRALREAERAAAQAVRERRARRRAWRSSLARRLRPAPRRWTWGFGRRSPAQRAILAGAAVVLLLAVWYFADSLATRLALTALVLLLLPVLAVVAFGRKGIRL
jgi:Flp pilus assembly protein TadB